jgi:hypothetical protein
MTEDQILTRHPHGKSGRKISRERYDAVKHAIVSALSSRELTHGELMNALSAALKRTFDGNINWYGETVKLDLEARKTIERTATTPAKYRVRQQRRRTAGRTTA